MPDNVECFDFGGKTFSDVIAKLGPQVDWGPDGEEPNEPWTDSPAFSAWLHSKKFSPAEIEYLLDTIPRVDLALNHGPLFGVARFINENSDDHKILEAGFVIVASGCNGDFIVVDRTDGRTGWLPMAMIWDMEAAEVSSHFVATNQNLAEFITHSEDQWLDVPKDWYDAKIRI
ncbi:hypothetical protein [Oceaniferula spumae]